MEISYWSDIACPFCYIGASRMKRAMAAVGLNPEVKPCSQSLLPVTV